MKHRYYVAAVHSMKKLFTCSDSLHPTLKIQLRKQHTSNCIISQATFTKLSQIRAVLNISIVTRERDGESEREAA